MNKPSPFTYNTLPHHNDKATLGGESTHYNNGTQQRSFSGKRGGNNKNNHRNKGQRPSRRPPRYPSKQSYRTKNSDGNQKQVFRRDNQQTVSQSHRAEKTVKSVDPPFANPEAWSPMPSSPSGFAPDPCQRDSCSNLMPPPGFAALVTPTMHPEGQTWKSNDHMYGRQQRDCRYANDNYFACPMNSKRSSQTLDPLKRRTRQRYDGPSVNGGYSTPPRNDTVPRRDEALVEGIVPNFLFPSEHSFILSNFGTPKETALPTSKAPVAVENTSFWTSAPTSGSSSGTPNTGNGGSFW